jgi:hypothetical protein
MAQKHYGSKAGNGFGAGGAWTANVTGQPLASPPGTAAKQGASDPVPLPDPMSRSAEQSTAAA